MLPKRTEIGLPLRHRAVTKPAVIRLPQVHVPHYTEGQYGPWSIDLIPPEDSKGQVFTARYYTGVGWEPVFYRLRRDGRTWMVASRLELESHQYHVKAAHGKVVVCGIGMGIYLYNILQKKNVESVVAIDVSDEIIPLLKKTANFDLWPGVEKLQVITADAKAVTLGEVPWVPDFTYVDIWPVLGADAAIPDTRLIAEKLRTQSVGWWGQEQDFVHFLLEKGLTAGDFIAPGIYQEFENKIGTKLYMPYPEYGMVAEAVAWSAAIRLSLSERSERSKDATSENASR